jgi:hypothetical protein
VTDAEMLQNAAKAMRERPQAMHPAVAFKVADLLDREARRVGSHAITTHKVREDWFAYDCHTCGVGGSTSRAGLAVWQESHSRVRPVADDALLVLARTYLATEETP